MKWTLVSATLICIGICVFTLGSQSQADDSKNKPSEHKTGYEIKRLQWELSRTEIDVREQELEIAKINAEINAASLKLHQIQLNDVMQKQEAVKPEEEPVGQEASDESDRDSKSKQLEVMKVKDAIKTLVAQRSQQAVKLCELRLRAAKQTSFVRNLRAVAFRQKHQD